jgi:hypothetical protein
MTWTVSSLLLLLAAFCAPLVLFWALLTLGLGAARSHGRGPDRNRHEAESRR